MKDVLFLLDTLAKLADGQPIPKKMRGRPRLPPEPDLTKQDKAILRLAQKYASDTGKRAANGAVGKKITNQGGPFVKLAAKELACPEKHVIARLDRMEKNPRLRSLWNTYRTPTAQLFADFLAAVPND